MSVHPDPTSDAVLKRVRTRHFAQAKANGIKITGLTSYDTLTAQIFDEAGIEIPDQADDEVEAFREFLDQINPEDFLG